MCLRGGMGNLVTALEIKDLASPVVSRDKAIRGGFVTTHQASESQLSILPPMPSQWRESRGKGTPSYSLGRVESVGSPFSLGCHGEAMFCILTLSISIPWLRWCFTVCVCMCVWCLETMEWLFSKIFFILLCYHFSEPLSRARWPCWSY